MNERDLFHAAMEIADAAKRSAYLDAQCGDDPTRRQHVQAMVEMQPRLGTFLESPAVDWGAATAPPLAAGRFALGEELACGGMGRVYRARDDSLGRDVAIKILHERYLLDSKVAERFLDEARITAQLQHPGIPPVFEVGRLADRRPYLAMKLIKGATLNELLQERPGADADRSGFLSIFQQICQAVGYAHSKRILHRDLKPANVMVGAFGEVQVMDWGLAKVLEEGARSVGSAGLEPAVTTETADGSLIQTARENDSATQAGSMLGTPAFLSPEQAGGELHRLDERTDVFGLGAILCVILTGQPPYVGTADEVRQMAVRGTRGEADARLDRCGADAKLVELCRQCLSADRDSRPRDAAAVADALAGYLAGVEERARRAEVELAAAQTRAAEQRKRRRVQLALAASVLVLIGLVGFGLWWRERVEATAAAELAVRESHTSGGVAEALREARKWVEDAWSLADFPERMQHATDMAVAALRHGEDLARDGAPDESTLANLDSARREVEEMARYSRLINAHAAITQKFAEEVTGQGWREPQVQLTRRYHEAFREFGLDPLRDPADEVAKAVASSRLRDIVLGMLLDWHWHTRGEDRLPLWEVIRSARQQSGGAYARWQELLDRKDAPGLVAFAASPDGLRFPPILLGALFRDLRDAGEHAAGRTFLRAAVERYPHEVWLHHDLADLCRKKQPPDYAEALRHSSAATVLRPDSAVFHLQLGDCYAGLRQYDQAVAAYRRSIDLGRGAVVGYVRMGTALAQKKDWNGAIAALREALSIQPKDASTRYALAQILSATGRHAEALQAVVAAMRERPDQAQQPRNYMRYNAACYALKCVDGLGTDAPPPAERPAYRNQALEFLTAELAALQKLAATDQALVQHSMQQWLAVKDLASVRDPMALETLPADERGAWNKLWAEVRVLAAQTQP